LVAAYHWSIIGQERWLPGTTGGQRVANPSRGSGARPVGSISSTSIVRQPILPESQQRPFFLLWSPLPSFQKRQLTALPAPTDRHDKSPIPTASAAHLAFSRRMKNRLGQIPHSWTIDGDGRPNFQIVPLAQPRRATAAPARPEENSLRPPLNPPCRFAARGACRDATIHAALTTGATQTHYERRLQPPSSGQPARPISCPG